MANSDKIRAALDQLDHGNDAHWTDDGLPRTGVVQKLANDPTIKRTDINEAAPAFSRKGNESDPPEMVQPREGDNLVSAETGEVDVSAETVNTEVDEPRDLTEEEVRALMDQNVSEAAAAIEAAKQKIRDGQAEERAATIALGNAKQDRDRAFPAISAMDNIKQHLASEHLKRVLAAQGNAVPQRIDMAFAAGNSRGWRRPVRPAVGVDGRLVMPVTRERKTFPVHNVKQAPPRTA